MPRLDDYLTIKQAAQFLGVSANTLRNWGAGGKLAVHRNPMNGYRLFKIDDLKRLLVDIEKSASSTVPRRSGKPK